VLAAVENGNSPAANGASAYTAGVPYPSALLPINTTVGLANGQYYLLAGADTADFRIVATAEAISVSTAEPTAPMSAFAATDASECLRDDRPVTGSQHSLGFATESYRQGAGVCIRTELPPTTQSAAEVVDLLIEVPGPVVSKVVPVRLGYAAYT
jgi:hypothetical protein